MLVKNKSLIKNSGWNILGVAIPSLIAIPAMGFMARLLGLEIFGLFTLAYAIVGYASIFDGGLSRAVIRAIAKDSACLGKAQKIIGTAGWTVLILGLLATVILWFSSPALSKLLNVSAENMSDTIKAFRWLSFSIPPLLLSSIWLSYLEGKERFSELNIIKIFSSSLLIVLPLFFVLGKPILSFAILGMVLGRYLTMFFALFVCIKNLKGNIWRFDKNTLVELFRFGSWITLSNLISPLMVYFDRFILANLVGAQKVAFYSAPAEAVSRLLIVPAAVSRALFPRLSRQSEDAQAQAKKSFWVLFLVCVSIAAPTFIFTEELMTLWMGVEYSGDSAKALKILLIGFIFNSIAQIPFSQIQAAGHSKVTALVHLCELGPYILLLYFLISEFSVLGAAMAWTLRVAIDFFIILIVKKRIDHVKTPPRVDSSRGSPIKSAQAARPVLK